MKKLSALFIVLLLAFTGISHAQETRGYDLVAEYIREFGAIEDARTLSYKEFQKIPSGDNAASMMSAVRFSARMNLELNTNINILKKMKLKKPFETLIPSTIAFYSQKIALYDEMSTIAKFMLAGLMGSHKSNVDYSPNATRMAEINAKLEFIDKALFESTPLVFAVLIDQKPDSENHVSHLLITRAQRQELIDKINNSFREKLDQSDPSYATNSAWVIRSFLSKDYKCSDDPW